MSQAGPLRPVLVFLVLLFPAWGCWSEVHEPPHTLQRNMLSSLVVPAAAPARAVTVVPRPPPHQVAAYGMNQEACETFDVQIDAEGKRRYRRNRKQWTMRDERRFRKLVDLVAREMGAEPRLFRAWSFRESTYRPSAIHVLNPDVEGAVAAWRKYKYSEEQALALTEELGQLDATSSRYWELKGALTRIQTFRDNPYFDDAMQYALLLPDGSRSTDFASIWAFGYGPFGFNPAYYIPLWDVNSPPWVFCGDDGLVAIVTAVWAAREHQRECAAQGVGDSYAVVNRRFGRGHCASSSRTEAFGQRLERLGVNPDARAKLGRKWPRASTDRGELLAHLRKKAREDGVYSTRVH